MSRQVRESRRKRQQGSALAEFGPALFFVLIFAFFPVLDIIGLGLGYMSAVSLNDLQLRQACKSPKSQATDPDGRVCLDIPKTYMTSIAGGLSSITELPVTDVAYEVDVPNIYVTVNTKVTVKPFLTIPFFPKVPGLGAPVTFNVTNSRMLENPSFAAY